MLHIGRLRSCSSISRGNRSWNYEHLIGPQIDTNNNFEHSEACVLGPTKSQTDIAGLSITRLLLKMGHYKRDLDYRDD